MHTTPLVLDFDASVGTPRGSFVVALADWHQRVRFGCSLRTYDALRQHLLPLLPHDAGPVLTGSGDFHHASLLLIERLADRGPLDVVVFDNHPDNMRYPWGIHCGSWVSHVARLPFVRHVQVMGITSNDVSLSHALENRLMPLWRGRVSYWCLGRSTSWARWSGLKGVIRSFDAAERMLDAFALQQASSRSPVYLSIDKDVLSTRVARTNWDQGVLVEEDLCHAIAAVGSRLVGCDITGDLSVARYEARWKRWLSQLDGQAELAAEQIREWQAAHHLLNDRLIVALRTRQATH